MANLQFPDALMSRHDAGEQAVAHQKLFPCPLCRSMIRNSRAFTPAFDEESIAGSIVPVKYWERKGKRRAMLGALARVILMCLD